MPREYSAGWLLACSIIVVNWGTGEPPVTAGVDTMSAVLIPFIRASTSALVSMNSHAVVDSWLVIRDQTGAFVTPIAMTSWISRPRAPVMPESVIQPKSVNDNGSQAATGLIGAVAP